MNMNRWLDYYGEWRFRNKYKTAVSLHPKDKDNHVVKLDDRKFGVNDHGMSMIVEKLGEIMGRYKPNLYCQPFFSERNSAMSIYFGFPEDCRKEILDLLKEIRAKENPR